MAKVLAAMRTSVAASTRRRPMRSPSGPKTSPPTGRTRNAAAKVPKLATTCRPGEPEGKKTLPSVAAR